MYFDSKQKPVRWHLDFKSGRLNTITQQTKAGLNLIRCTRIYLYLWACLNSYSQFIPGILPGMCLMENLIKKFDVSGSNCQWASTAICRAHGLNLWCSCRNECNNEHSKIRQYKYQIYKSNRIFCFIHVLLVFGFTLLYPDRALTKVFFFNRRPH